ncbi:hypothetical protein [Flavobacterium okayamense]|uniref:Lipoprotein n=1 Tax=Flavobacterium okayamense TaxID=2830782 RepID=A0ABM7S3W8_9FLAO|nr:hypothetical protein [Flavobacterium okayamense]BCY27564.1 hypothetical protein KK2020170_04320 [Flavobacterium okayamense]
MKNPLILFSFFLFLSCHNNDKINLENKSKVNQQLKNKTNSLVIDTLVFSESMKGELLDKKIIESKKKLKFYKKFTHTKAINKIQIIEDKHSKTELIYLGEIYDIDNSNSYKVISNFKLIGINELLSPKGKSEIAFIDNNYNIMVYDMGMPENLPKYINDNVLYFNIKNTKIGIQISGGLSPMFCIPKIGCNE